MSKLQQKSQESMGEQCDGKIPLFHEFSRFVSRSVDTDMQIIAFARRYMEKTRGFKLISWINSERKSLIFAGIHLVTTLIIYQHFFYSKFRVQEAAIKEGANRYWEKRLIPPLEFGAMHAILFQMALLPLTMCRVSLARLAQTELERFVPFNRITAFHIHLGYTMITFVLVGTVVFFIFFGIMCDEQKRGIEPLNKKGEEQWCDKMTSEIMLTGIGILVALVLVLVTSYLRDRIPYELFYNVHHIVFLMFAVTVAHTLDVDQRSGAKARSQTFKWFSASLAYYILDRAYAHVSMSFKCIVDWSGTHALSQSNDHSERVVVLKFTRPGALRFVPGQYVYLRIPAIDGTWHPYSVGSGPMDKSLLFFIEVYQQGSWSDRLWKLIHETSADKAISAMPLEEIFVDVQGPFGAAVANVARFTDCVAIGAGTGVVPMLSLLRQNTDRLRLIHPDSFVDYTRDMKKKLKHYVATTSTHNATLATKLRKSVSGLFGYADFDSVAIQQNTHAIPGITSSERRNTNSLARDNSLRKSLTRGDSIRRKTLNRKSQFSAVAYTNVANSLAGTKDLLWSRVKTAHVDELAACRIQMWIRSIMLQRFTSRGQQSQAAELPALARKMLHRRSALSSYMQLMTLLSVLPVLGIAVVSLAVSFNTQDHALDTGMVLYLEISTLFGIAGFLCHTIFLNPSSQFLSWVDYALGAGALGFTIAWTVNRSWGHFTNLEQVVFIILGFYMAIRTWYYCVKEHGLVGEYLGWSREVIALESFKLVWVVRSLSLAQEILPEIEAIQRSASTVWGSALHNVQNVAVYITDSDVKARNQFVQSMRSRVPNVQLFSGRPDFDDLLVHHLRTKIFMDRINSEVVGSHTLITFCGSPALGRHVESARLELQVLAEIAGVRHHTAVFQQENYGQAGAPKPPSASEKQHLRASSVSPEPSGKDQIRIASKVTTDSQSVESLDV